MGSDDSRNAEQGAHTKEGLDTDGRFIKAHEDPVRTGIWDRRPPTGCHEISDITISGIRTSGLGAAHRTHRRGRASQERSM